jgi:hypothetical protein
MRILLPVCRGIRENSFYQEFLRGVIEALEELGHQPVQFHFGKVGETTYQEQQSLLQLLGEVKVGAVLDLACWGFALSRFLTQWREPIFDAFEIPYVGVLFDHPPNQAISAILARDLHLGYPDLGHSSQVRLVFPQLKPMSELFAPPAVRPRQGQGIEASPRDIDVLYVGNLQPELLERFWNIRTHLFWSPDFDPRLCDATVDRICEQPERPLHESLREVLARFYPAPVPRTLLQSVRAIEIHMRHRFRRDAVVALASAGVRLKVVGDGWDRIALAANAQLIPATDYDGMFRLATRAKIALDASTYVDGVNDRVFSYGISGAVCFTNAAGYLRVMDDQAGALCFYSMSRLAEMAEQINALLARPAALAEGAERARAGVLSAHTWRHRIPALLAPLTQQRA